LNGKDLRERRLLERRAKLRELVPSEHPFLFSEEFTGDVAAFFQACADHQLEGIVSKLASSKYRSGRSKTWLKTKCFTESSFVIIGTARDRKTKAPLALLARTNAQGLTYVGLAFIALTGTERAELALAYKRASSNAAQFRNCVSLTLSGWPLSTLPAYVISRGAAIFGTQP
jgi:bifunctional non-homologous end joining protein LigD